MGQLAAAAGSSGCARTQQVPPEYLASGLQVLSPMHAVLYSGLGITTTRWYLQCQSYNCILMVPTTSSDMSFAWLAWLGCVGFLVRRVSAKNKHLSGEATVWPAVLSFGASGTLGTDVVYL